MIETGRALPAVLLLLVAWGFVFLSATVAEALGLGRLRVVAFALVVGALLALAVARAACFSIRGRGLALILAALYWAIFALHPEVPFDPLDHKLLAVLAVLLLAPELARLFAGVALARLTLAVLGAYVVASAGVLLLGGGQGMFRGAGGVVRLDVSGSMIVHASLMAIFLPPALLALRRERRAWVRVLGLPAVGLALAMLFWVATRTALLTLLLYGLLELVAGPWRRRLGPLLLAALAGGVVFALFTLFVSDALWLRLVGAGPAPWASGRGEALAYWTAVAFDHPLGLGIGALRRAFAEGRPVLDGAVLLEWPHNELVRLWVEGGLLGLVFALLLVGGLVLRAVRAARLEPDPAARSLLLVLAADLFAQSLLQNYFNNVYQATVVVLTLVLLAARAHVRAEETAVRAEQDLWASAAVVGER